MPAGLITSCKMEKRKQAVVLSKCKSNFFLSKGSFNNDKIQSLTPVLLLFRDSNR